MRGGGFSLQARRYREADRDVTRYYFEASLTRDTPSECESEVMVSVANQRAAKSAVETRTGSKSL